ncbi:hypothetical protein DMA11_15765 [Marinilabiliaceae bacterium JC017]|nr:hypothetical protein DMA11_15765 [Marinilabiliaceae bacterium JC017]
MQKIINRTSNGNIFICSHCERIHIEYKNLNFNFSRQEFDYFARYFMNLDGDYWERVNAGAIYRRKILIPVGHKNLCLLMNKQELSEFRQLLRGRKKEPSYDMAISARDIGLSMHVN